jgi:hypothetical protein
MVILLIALVAIVGLFFNGLLFQNNRSQEKVDAMAVSLAGLINAGNRVGQMNELEDRCRELIYVSRQNEIACDSGQFSFMSELCNRLLLDARAGQQIVEQERLNQTRLIKDEVQQAALNYNKVRSNSGWFSLHGLTTDDPLVTDVALGTIRGVQSNVRCQRVFPQWAYYDYNAGYFNSANGLYGGNVDARLPQPDDDLHFKLSALPASVDNVTALPRNTNPDVFIPYFKVMDKGQAVPNYCPDIPNAVEVSCVMHSSFGSTGSNKASLKIISDAITSGASPEVDDSPEQAMVPPKH